MSAIENLQMWEERSQFSNKQSKSRQQKQKLPDLFSLVLPNRIQWVLHFWQNEIRKRPRRYFRGCSRLNWWTVSPPWTRWPALPSWQSHNLPTHLSVASCAVSVGGLMLRSLHDNCRLRVTQQRAVSLGANTMSECKVIKSQKNIIKRQPCFLSSRGLSEVATQFTHDSLAALKQRESKTLPSLCMKPNSRPLSSATLRKTFSNAKPCAAFASF